MVIKRKGLRNKVSWYKWVIRFLMLFGFLFNINLILHISTTNLCSFLALVYIVMHKTQVQRVILLFKKVNILLYVSLLFACALICLINSEISGTNIGTIETLRVIDIFLLIFRVLIFSIYCLVEYPKFEDFAKMMVAAFSVQAFAVFAAIINPEIRLFLYEHFYFGDDRLNYSVEQGSRIIGIALNSASGGVTCSTVFVIFLFPLDD